MTNVPQTIRDAWADVYRLFDVSYGMDGSDQAWETYWNKANEIVLKYANDIPLLPLLISVSEIIKHLVDERKSKQAENEQKILPWGKDEDYPYPKDLNGI